MDTVVLVLISVAEVVDWVRALGWWLVPIITPGLAVWVWLWLRPTGRHRRPVPHRPVPPPRPSPPVVDLDDDADSATIVFQPVTYADAPTASGGGEADR
ncbi:hypothetical protein ABT300_19070 [Streptomyces sp. NPDC001027]|uniref:hypothetical protein n=1 Tax=Streptomyces sp. NPDC001027 TaxID=3154771 RepID=UPI00331903A5